MKYTTFLRSLIRVPGNCVVMSTSLRELGSTHGLAIPIVNWSSTLVEYLLGSLRHRAGINQVTPDSRFILVSLSPSVCKAVSVLDSHDGLSGVKHTRSLRKTHTAMPMPMTVLIRDRRGVS